MLKKYTLLQATLFILLFSYQANSTRIVANPTTEQASSEACNLPAPTNLAVVAISVNFIHLSWTSSLIQGLKRITVYTQDSENSPWEPVATYNVLGSNFAVPNLNYDLGKTAFSISEVCEYGEPGEESGLAKPPIAFILDLTVGGRTPSNLVSVPECKDITVSNDAWFGFEITYKGVNPPSNLFEVSYPGKYVISRVKDNNIVEGLMDHEYPLFPGEEIQKDPNDFYVFKILNGGLFTDIGRINVFHDWDGNNHKFQICRYPGYPWNNDYLLRVYIGSISNPGNGLSKQLVLERDKFINENEINVQNPITGSLNILMTSQEHDNSAKTISIWGINGELMLEVDLTESEKNIQIDTESLKAGLYVVQISSIFGTNSYKVVKL